MPTAYRVELSKSARAGCKNKECKDAGVKIQKSELRFGTLVTIPNGESENTSWHWKHWGCVTPQVIGNLKEQIDGDMDLVDGLDELPQEHQETVIKAIEQGHVNDEDWRGDPEMNRPGKRGFRVRTPKKKAAAEDDDAEPESPTQKPAKKRGKARKLESDGEEEAPPPKKARGRPKKLSETEGGDADEEPAPKKARGRPKKQAKDNADEAAAPASKTAKGKAKKDANGTAAGEAEPAPQAEAKPKKGRVVKKAPVVEDDEDEEAVKDEDDAGNDSEVLKPNQGRKRKSAKKAADANGATKPKSKRGVKTKA